MLSPSRSRLLWIAVLALLLVGLGLAVRFWLPGYTVRSVLGLMGAGKIQYAQVRGTPWRMVVEDLRFQVQSQRLAARRVTVEREQWWSATLGKVTVEGAQVAVTLDGSDADPTNWSAYHDTGLGDEPVNLPFESLDLAGELVVQAAAAPDIPIAVKLEARQKSGTSWIGSLVAEGAGFRLAGNGALLRAGQELDFQVHSAELDLETWSRHIQRLVLLPGGPWAMGGKLTGVGEGKVTAKRFAATARVTLREGHMRASGLEIAATGAEADLEFSDLWKLRTKAGELRVREIRLGQLSLSELVADFGLWDGKTTIFNATTFQALGGRARVQPFRYQLHQRELLAIVEAENLDLARIMDLTSKLPLKVTGRAGGQLPLRIQDDGVRLERGQLNLQPGSSAELRVNAATLLRSGATLPPTTLAGLRKAGNTDLVIQLGSLRLDLRPADIPLGSTARVQAAGETEQGPVEFTFNINGSVEKYLNVLPGRR